MELTVRPALPTDYEEIDRLTLKGFKTAHQTDDPVARGGSLPISRSSSYVCTVKGSAYMRSTDALTFVCVKHTMKQGLMETIFGRVPRKGSDASGSRDSAGGRASVCYEDLGDIVNERRESAKSIEVESIQANRSRRASSGMRVTRNVSGTSHAGKIDIDVEVGNSSPTASCDSRSTSATNYKEADHHSSKKGGKRHADVEEQSFVLFAAEASSNSMEHYKSIGTLRGHEVEFGLGAGIRTRVKRHEGPGERLLDREEAENHESNSVYNPSRGTSAYKKPDHIDLEARVSPEGYLMARPSPLVDASAYLEAKPAEHARRGSTNSAEKPLETPFRFFHRRHGSSSSAKHCNPCGFDNCIEEKIVGSVTYAPYESGWGIVSEANDVELRMLSVNPVRGVAGLLIDHCVRIAQDELRSAIHVLVNSNNKAAHLLYIRHGFLRNPLKDRFDLNASLSLKCFTMDLGNPRPEVLSLSAGGDKLHDSVDADTVGEMRGTAGAGARATGHPGNGLGPGNGLNVTTLMGVASPEGNRAQGDRARAGLIFNLRSLRLQRLNLYQDLKSER